MVSIEITSDHFASAATNRADFAGCTRFHGIFGKGAKPFEFRAVFPHCREFRAIGTVPFF